MTNWNIVVPCVVLGSICLGMLVFIWIWFPRKWNKGGKSEEEAIDMAIDAGMGSDGEGLTPEERRRIAGQRAREYLAAVDERNKARAEGRELPPVHLRMDGRQSAPNDNTYGMVR